MATPYSLAKLPPAIREALTPYAPYSTTEKVRALVDGADVPDAESSLCLAWLEWQDGLATELDEDVVQAGETALAILDDAAALASHRGAGTLRREIERRMKVARREITKVAKLADVDETALGLEEAKELVFVILDSRGASTALLYKAHRLAVRLVAEVPDQIGEAYANTLYYSNQAAQALWRAGEREAARPLLEALIAWPVERDAKLYEFAISGSLSLLMEEAIERDDSRELERLLLRLRDRFAALGKTPTLSHADCDNFLAYAIDRCAPEALAVLAAQYTGRSERSLSKATRAHLAALRGR